MNRIDFSAGSFDTYEGSIFRAASAGSVDYSLGYCGFATQGDFRFQRPTYVSEDGQNSSFDYDEAERINNDRIQHGATLGLGVPLGRGQLRFGDYFAHSHGGEPGIDYCNEIDGCQNREARSTDWSNLAQLRWDASALGRLGDDLALSIYHRYESSAFENPPSDSYSDGIDANMHMGYILTELDKLSKNLLNGKKHSLLGPASLHVPLIRGGTELFIYADACTISVERRTLPGEEHADILREIETIISSIQQKYKDLFATYKTIIHRNAYEISPQSQIVKLLEEKTINIRHKKPQLIGHHWWEDSALIAATGAETVIFGPIGAGLHSHEEYVDLQSVFDLATILVNVINTYCN